MLKGQPYRSPHPKYVQLGQYLHKKLSFIYEFQVVIFAFSLILGDPFMVSPSPLKYGGGGTFLQKLLFMGDRRTNLWEH